MEFKDYYRLMGVSKTAPADEIKKAFRKKARQYHPDVSKEPDAANRMAELNEANAVLSDPEKRAAYDTLASQPQATHAGQAYQPPPHWDSGYEFSGGADDLEGERSDFFEQLFGRSARANRQRREAAGRGSGQSQAQRGNDHHARIELELVDAYAGALRTITLQAGRLDGSGHLVREERHLEVKIPKGVREGQHIRLAGQGSPGLAGGPPGDLLLEVAFKPDARWHAEGRDVHQTLGLSPWEAALGAEIMVHTPGGELEVQVPAGWRRGRKLRLKQRGIPGQPSGDLFLTLEVALPPAETDAARVAYTALAQACPAFNPRLPQGA
ncbi:DnaJ C-terminal domain-containing protein [Curvibacter sp. HBC28]|uniref:DnaJ C-terminal domain-containing protein n=1 Tax=Curvibacter microcysteis TaxID=3026419 RepID=A0ABT5M9Z1_9BURK|nr:DnaJ C-terminal domain-containing protein [Curvibacter sp. HBC28]MDD0813246.1 DnaJ C-terminal domain-containing protein [Curvibacter sp. HBC28]